MFADVHGHRPDHGQGIYQVASRRPPIDTYTDAAWDAAPYDITSDGRTPGKTFTVKAGESLSGKLNLGRR